MNWHKVIIKEQDVDLRILILSQLVCLETGATMRFEDQNGKNCLVFYAPNARMGVVLAEFKDRDDTYAYESALCGILQVVSINISFQNSSKEQVVPLHLPGDYPSTKKHAAKSA